MVIMINSGSLKNTHMATKRAARTNLLATHSGSQPDWAIEAFEPHRALWEVAAMAGNVAPRAAAVREKKAGDLEWKVGYEKLIRVMTNALSPRRGTVADHIFYEEQRSANAIRTQDTALLRQVRVDVASAIEFLWSYYGDDVTPEGFHVIHSSLRKGQTSDAVHDEELSEAETAASHLEALGVLQVTDTAAREEARAIEDVELASASLVQEGLKPSTSAHRDQRLANATKEKQRLGALVYILMYERYAYQGDVLPSDILEDVLDSVHTTGFGSVEGFGDAAIEKLLKNCFKYYTDLKPSQPRDPS